MDNRSTKQEQYARQKVRLKQALKYSFFYEAVLIEYAMFEDRATSVIKHLNCRTTNRRGNPLKLSEKLNVINDNPAFQASYIKNRLPRELIEKIRSWKEKRDQLVHGLMTPSPEEALGKEIAEEGNELLRIFDNKVQSICRHYSRKEEIQNES